MRAYIGLLPMLLLLTAFLLTFSSTLPAFAAVCPFSWERDLRLGSTGEDVHALQRYLNQNAATEVSASGPGSSNNETTKFGGLTKAAVIKFQEKYFNEILAPNGLSKGTGTVGPSTRATLNALCALEVQGKTSGEQVAASAAAITDALRVSDPGQGENVIAPPNASFLALTFTLQAGSKDITVSEVSVERRGFGADGAFYSFGLWDEKGYQIGPIGRLNAQHRIVFRAPFVLKAGTSQTFEVWATMKADLTSYVGQVPIFQLVDVKASSPLEGALPLTGSAITVINSLTIGSADAALSSYDPGGARTQYIFDKGVRFSGIRITAHAQEDLVFTNIIWTQSGTAGLSDIENVKVVVGGKEYDTEISPYSDREYAVFFDPGILIKKGESIEVYIKGDLLPGAANRTVQFDIRDINDELALEGDLYHFGVGITPASNTVESGTRPGFVTSDGTTSGDTGTPWFAGSTFTIKATGVGSIQRN